MLGVIFICGVPLAALLGGATIGGVAQGRARRILFAAWIAAPLLLWLLAGVKDGCTSPGGGASCVYGFWAGLMLVALVMPVWAGLSYFGLSLARRPHPRIGSRPGP
jgi:hypothetical protein